MAEFRAMTRPLSQSLQRTYIGKRFAFATTFTLRYDNAPLPGIRRLDTITSFSLVFRFI